MSKVKDISKLAARYEAENCPIYDTTSLTGCEIGLLLRSYRAAIEALTVVDTDLYTHETINKLHTNVYRLTILQKNHRNHNKGIMAAKHIKQFRIDLTNRSSISNSVKTSLLHNIK